MPRGPRVPSWSAIVTFGLFLSVGCVTVRLDVTFAPGSFDMKSHGTTVLQDPAQRPIHVGDGGPDAEPIPAEHRLANPAQGRGWRVVVDQPPGAAELEATIESLAPIDDPAGCYAEVVVNDRAVGRLQAPRGTPAGAVSVVKVPIPAGSSRSGRTGWRSSSASAPDARPGPLRRPLDPQRAAAGALTPEVPASRRLILL